MRVRLYRLISSWCRAGEADLVEVPDSRGQAALWPSLPVPVVARLHISRTVSAAHLGGSLKPMSRWLELKSLQRADFWCSVSRNVADETRRIFGLEKAGLEVIYNPVVVPDLDPMGERKPGFAVFHGTYNHNKGVERLVEAWLRVRETVPNAELHLFGKDGRTASGAWMIAHLVSRFGDLGRHGVHLGRFVGHEVLAEVLRSASVAVYPSLSEAFALAPMEAMAHGAPTIFTQRCSGPELIEHEVDGLLVDPESPAQIADAILRVLRDRELAQRLGEAGRRKMETRFALPMILEQNVRFYESCIAKFRRAAR